MPASAAGTAGRSRLAAAAIACLALAGLAASEQAPILLGIPGREGEDDEFRRYHPLATDLRVEGIESFLVDPRHFTNPPSDADLERTLSRCRVIYVRTLEEGSPRLTPASAAAATRVGEVLARWVGAGGGLLLAPSNVRYPNNDDQVWWNLLIKPLGVEIRREGLVDLKRSAAIRTEWLIDHQFWWTRGITAHPVTAGIASLWFPWHADGPGPRRPGTAALRYSDDWQVVVRGEDTAASYGVGDDNNLDTARPGSIAGAAPVVAVRQLGKGRVVCYPVFNSHIVDQYGKPGWKHVVERDGHAGIPGGGMRLLVNATRWLAEPSLGDPRFGTAVLRPWTAVTWPTAAVLDPAKLPKPGAAGEVRGILGAHTAASDGSGTVAEYAAAAKAAGLAFVVFNESLEKMTPEKFDALDRDCAAASQDGAFWAVPGLEFSDHHGNRWAVWGDKVRFPKATISKGQGREFVQWDGQRLHQFLSYIHDQTALGRGTALISFRQLEEHGGHLEKLSWYYHVFPLAYEGSRLIADNTAAYRATQRDLRRIAVASFTRIHSPAEVATAAATATTRYPSLERAKAGLTGTCSDWDPVGYTSQGPRIRQWLVANQQMGHNWRATRGSQRVIARFAVQAEAGIAEVLVHDAEQTAFRRFAGEGATTLERDFEVVHDRQHWLMLEVVDRAGRRAFSAPCWVFSYTEGHARCGDNANWQDSGSEIMWPGEQLLAVARGTPRGTYAEMSRDGASALAPLAVCHEVADTIDIQGVGPYPRKEALGKVTTARLASTNIIIVDQRMDRLSDQRDPARTHLGWIPADIAGNEWFERTHTSYFLRDRRDFNLIWGMRRNREGHAPYQGGLIWNEGEIRFKKDCVLDGDLPIPLLRMVAPRDRARGFGGSLLVVDAERGRQVLAVDESRDTVVTGTLAAGGFASLLPCGRWHPTVFAPAGSELTYRIRFPKDWIDGEWSGDELIVGLGRKGQAVKAGTVLRYRFAAGTLLDQADGGHTAEAAWTKLAGIASGCNCGGGQAGYALTATTGSVLDATFFCRLRASAGEASFSAGPQALPIDLPIQVQGVEDNGCAAVFSTVRPWFRFLPVHDGAAWFQEPIDAVNRMWVGNLFLSDAKALRLNVVIDGQPAGAQPFIEVHNPTTADISARLWSPPGTPEIGGLSGPVAVPAGTSVRVPFTALAIQRWQEPKPDVR